MVFYQQADFANLRSNMKGQSAWHTCDSSSFSEKFSWDGHMTSMIVNKHNKEFQHFLFLCGYNLKFSFSK